MSDESNVVGWHCRDNSRPGRVSILLSAISVSSIARVKHSVASPEKEEWMGKKAMPPLDRAKVVATALGLLDGVGLEGLTVRRLAEELDVQNPTLYWHFKDKQALVDAMADALLATWYRPPRKGISWQTWLRTSCQRFRQAMLSHRDGARLVAATDVSRTTLMLMVEDSLKILLDAGFPAGDALSSVLVALHFTLGTTFEEQVDPANSVPPETRLDAARFPTISMVLQEVQRIAKTSRAKTPFEEGLSILIAGMETRIDASNHKSRRRRP
ncbi:MAG: TetR/AcrR family transcriptional regulator C-terminal domain-containing protein [Mesorhizobium sp.]